MDADGFYDDATGVAPVFNAAGSAGTTVTVELRVTDSDGNTDLDTANVTIMPSPVTETYISTDTPLAIPDRDSVDSTIGVSDSYFIEDLTVQIDSNHARPSDLTITLTSPAGTEISLPPTGGSGEAFVGDDVNGTWTLNVADGKKRREGTLDSWSLVVTPAAAGGAASYSLPPVAAVCSPTDLTDGIASLREIESPRVPLTEGFVSTDQLQWLLRSETKIQEQAADRRGLANWDRSRAESHGASADGLGNIYISGETIGSSWHQEVFISKYDASGTLQWIQQFGTDGKNFYGRDVSADGLGNVYITGETRGGSLGGAFAGGFSDAFVAKYVDLAVQADFDGDGDVDGDDFLAWQVGFGAQAGAQKSDEDYDNDGDVDGDDFIGWQTQFDNGGNAAGAAVPEPSSVLLLLAALSLSLTGPILRNVTRAA